MRQLEACTIRPGWTACRHRTVVRPASASRSAAGAAHPPSRSSSDHGPAPDRPRGRAVRRSASPGRAARVTRGVAFRGLRRVWPTVALGRLRRRCLRRRHLLPPATVAERSPQSAAIRGACVRVPGIHHDPASRWRCRYLYAATVAPRVLGGDPDRRPPAAADAGRGAAGRDDRRRRWSSRRRPAPAVRAARAAGPRAARARYGLDRSTTGTDVSRR